MAYRTPLRGVAEARGTAVRVEVAGKSVPRRATVAAGGCELRRSVYATAALDHHIEHGIWGGRISGQGAQLIPKETP